MSTTLPQPSPESDWTSRLTNTKRLQVLQQRPMYGHILRSLSDETPSDLKHLINMLIEHCITLEISLSKSLFGPNGASRPAELQAELARKMKLPPDPYDPPFA